MKVYSKKIVNVWVLDTIWEETTALVIQYLFGVSVVIFMFGVMFRLL